MNRVSVPSSLATGAAVVAVVALWTATGHGQLASAPASRAIVSLAGLPAMDRGLRAQDAPRAARTGGNTSHARVTGGDALPYLRGSLIVKFKDDARAQPSAPSPRVAGQVVDRSAGRTSTSSTSPPTSIRGQRSGAARQTEVSARSRAISIAMARPNDTLRQSVEFPGDRHGTGLGHQPGARPTSLSPCSTAAWPSARSRSIQLAFRSGLRPMAPVSGTRTRAGAVCRRAGTGQSGRRGS